jgi:DNA-directed RNA polymerase
VTRKGSLLEHLRFKLATEEEPDAVLVKEQQELEDQSVAEGLVQYRRRVEEAASAGHYSVSEPGKAFLAEWLEPLARHLKARCEARNRGRTPTWIEAIRKVGCEEAAFLTLRALIDGLVFREDEEETDRPTVTQIALHLGWMVKQELQDLKMREREKAMVGLGLLGECVQALPGLVTIRKRFYRKSAASDGLKTHHALILTEEALERVTALDSRLSLLHPIYMPTVIPPRPWEPGQRGGYHFALQDRYPLARPKYRIPDAAWEMFREKIDGADMYPVYQVLNVLQNVGWRINRAVWTLVSEIQQRGHPLHSAPSGLVQAAELLFGKDSCGNEAEQGQWAKRLETRRILGMAERFLDCEFYYPLKLDFRGRVYTVPSGLDPQGNDLARGLLMFAPRHAKPLGKYGRTFLAQHGVNTLGTDPRSGSL